VRTRKIHIFVCGGKGGGIIIGATAKNLV
jgi:hypothetical protein